MPLEKTASFTSFPVRSHGLIFQRFPHVRDIVFKGFSSPFNLGCSLPSTQTTRLVKWILSLVQNQIQHTDSDGAAFFTRTLPPPNSLQNRFCKGRLQVHGWEVANHSRCVRGRGGEDNTQWQHLIGSFLMGVLYLEAEGGRRG